MSLAFIAAVQTLPARQRAVLLLRDVLGWSARDTAATLDIPSLRSTAPCSGRGPPCGGVFQAASLTRTALPTTGSAGCSTAMSRPGTTPTSAAFVALLRDDVVWTMPPWREWQSGARRFGTSWRWVWQSERDRLERLVPTAANAQPAFAYYRSQVTHGMTPVRHPGAHAERGRRCRGDELRQSSAVGALRPPVGPANRAARNRSPTDDFRRRRGSRWVRRRHARDRRHWKSGVHLHRRPRSESVGRRSTSSTWERSATHSTSVLTP